MPFLNDIDAGGAHPFLAPDSGSNVVNVIIEGLKSFPVNRGGKVTTHNVTFFVKGWQAIGGQNSMTIAATRYILRQCEQIARNRDMGPVYIRWTSTGDNTGTYLNQFDLADGWYWITQFKPDYKRVPSGIVPVSMQVTEVAQGGVERSVALRYAPQVPGLPTNYSGASSLLLAAPFGASEAGWASRTGAEGAIPILPFAAGSSALINPYPIQLPATIGNWFKGGVRVYDTINTGTNPIPLSGGFVHANWVQVYDASHRFEGDCVVTNGLVLLLLQVGLSGQVGVWYLWNTALGTAAWQSPETVATWDSGGTNAMTLRSYRLERVGPDAVQITGTYNSAPGYYADLRFRVERGSGVTRVDVTPRNFTSTMPLSFGTPGSAYNVLGWDSSHVADSTLSAERSINAVATDYGYTGILPKLAGATYPMVGVILCANKPSSSDIYLGATGGFVSDSISAGATFSYGVAFIPFPNAQNLQGEAESGTLANGWASAVDAAASAGHAAKLASGTGGATALLTWMTAQSLEAGTWTAAVRVRTTTGTNASATQRFYVYDVTASAGVAPLISLAPNAVGTTYKWVFVSGTFTPTAGHTYQIRCDQGLGVNATDDWFVDEGVFLPVTLTTDNRGPQELWQQFMADRTLRMVTT